MAIVPKYGRTVPAAGPSSPYGFHVSLYSQGFRAWEQALGQIGDVLREQDREIRAARESTEIVGRSSRFALDLNKLLTQTAELTVDGRPATPEQQEAYFTSQTDQLGKAAQDWKGASPSARARLQNSLTAETTQQITTLRQINRQRHFKEIEDTMSLGEKTAVQMNNEVLYRETLDTGVAHGIITETVREQRIKDFPNEVKIEQLRAKATDPRADLDTVIQTAVALQGSPDMNLSQRQRLREVEGIASAQKVSAERAKAQISDEEMNKVLAATRTQPLGFVLTKIAQSDKLTEFQKITAAKAVHGAAELWTQKKINPWEDTQDYPSLVATLRKIRNGDITTRDGITAEWLKDGTAHWKLSDHEMAQRVLDAKYGGFPPENSADPLSSQYVDKLMDLWLDKEGKTDNPSGLAVAVNQVLDTRKRSGNDPNAMEKDIAPVIEKAKEQKAKRLLTGWAGVRKAMDYTFGSGGRNRMFTDIFTGNYMMGEVEDIAHPKNQAEYDALPKGAQYQDQDGSIWIKD